MIDEEKLAEEYIKDNYERWVRDCLSAEDIAKENFIVGLKVGSQLDMVWHDYDAGEDCYEDTHEGRWIKREDDKPKWHDLRKDPNDLPEAYMSIINQDGVKVLYDYIYRVWRYDDSNEFICDTPIAWCEIPTYSYTEESESGEQASC